MTRHTAGQLSWRGAQVLGLLLGAAVGYFSGHLWLAPLTVALLALLVGLAAFGQLCKDKIDQMKQLDDMRRRLDVCLHTPDQYLRERVGMLLAVLNASIDDR